nr:hypothetical protein CFP56_19916 [Quercus suber]
MKIYFSFSVVGVQSIISTFFREHYTDIHNKTTRSECQASGQLDSWTEPTLTDLACPENFQPKVMFVFLSRF